jgi:hypothetical protein
MRAAQAVTGAHRGKPPPDRGSWDRLVREVVAARDQRVVVSSERFASADSAAARRVVDDLGGPKVHVVVTLRPLTTMMPSAWQQVVRLGLRDSYETWLAKMLDSLPDGDEPHDSPFWHRHRHDRLVDRWAAVVGPANLTVVVLDKTNRALLTHVFERLLGLPEGLLGPPVTANPSLTFGESELIRHLNQQLDRERCLNGRRRTLVRRRITRQLQRGNGERGPSQRIRTPAWAVERLVEIDTTAAGAIARSGVRIVGDVNELGARPEAAPEPDDTATEPQAVLAASSAASALVATILALNEDRHAAPSANGSVDGHSGRHVLRRVGRRLRPSQVKAPAVRPLRETHEVDLAGHQLQIDR